MGNVALEESFVLPKTDDENVSRIGTDTSRHVDLTYL